MATLADIGVSAAFNIISALAFLVAFAILRLQPFNDRVYFPKWYLKGLRSSPTHDGAVLSKFVNLDYRSYLKFLNWMPDALRMPEAELIDHAGLDSAVYLRIYLLGLKIFVPITLLAFAILVPVNWTNDTLKKSDLNYSEIDKLSISNIPPGSQRVGNTWSNVTRKGWPSGKGEGGTLWVRHTVSSSISPRQSNVGPVVVSFRNPKAHGTSQTSVLVRNVPPDPDESVSELVEHFFLVNHPDHYLTHQVVHNANTLAKLVKKKKKMQNWLDFYQLKYSRNPSERPTTKTGFLGLWGARVDAMDFYTAEIDKTIEQVTAERDRVTNDPKAIMPAAFVSFKTRWGAAVCAQTQQSRNPTLWLTDWASEPRDVYWPNLAIPFVSLTVRRLIIAVAFFFLTFFFMIPIAIVQSLANLEGIEKSAPFLRPLIEMHFIKGVIQGFLPGIALKLFLIFLPSILMLFSKIEGFTSLSALERRSASKFYIFQLVNVFLGSVIAGTAFQQLHSFIHQSANEYPNSFSSSEDISKVIEYGALEASIPKTIGVAIPMKATFFITYIMVDGWAGIAGEILRLKPLVIFHLKNFFLVKTEKDREEAMDPGSIGFNTGEPQIQLYFLLGLVYAVVTPILLPFVLVFFGLAYVVFRHQLLLLGLLSTKEKAQTTPVLLALPVLTIWFYYYCKNRFESAFTKYPLQEAMMKDTLERAREPNLNLKGYLQNAYIHPVFKGDDDDESVEVIDEWEKESLVPTKRQSRRNTPLPSKYSGSSSPSLPEVVHEKA
ncbi:hypothetical protein Syun_031688 [Stephania yunnanensis]|uniref:Calcium permeable stress-gated cation channel 1 n=1 Tax=Stephania yunnanensis TaxID=152371 RepID=A0AAP0HH35_9MAGN